MLFRYLNINSDASGKLIIHDINNKRPEIEPYGTPHLLICLHERFVEMNNIWWSRASKALERSKKTASLISQTDNFVTY